MKHYLTLLFAILVAFSSCNKSPTDFRVIFNTNATTDVYAFYEIDGSKRTFQISPGVTEKKITLKKRQEMKVGVESNTSDNISTYLTVYRGNKEVGKNSHYGGVTITINYKGKVIRKSEPVYNNPGSSGSSYCGAPTQDGTPCKRKVSGGGRCWQHK